MDEWIGLTLKLVYIYLESLRLPVGKVYNLNNIKEIKVKKENRTMIEYFAKRL